MKTKQLKKEEHKIMCSCGKFAIRCKEASEAINFLTNLATQEAKKELLKFIDEIEIDKIELIKHEHGTERELSEKETKKKFLFSWEKVTELHRRSYNLALKDLKEWINKKD